MFEYSKGAEHNWCIKSTWTLVFIQGAIKLQTMVSLFNEDRDYKVELWVYLFVYLLIVIVSVLALFFSVLPEEFVPHTSDYAPLYARRQAEKLSDQSGTAYGTRTVCVDSICAVSCTDSNWLLLQPF
jgi:hypothetical protein